MHDETYRMLGKEHQADLEREARKRQLAAEVRRARPDPQRAGDTNRARESPRIGRQGVVAFLLRVARAEG
jgi:hypothetical protein